MKATDSNHDTDAKIQERVLKELRWDTRVEQTDVGVEVDDGVVTLSGTTSSWAKRMAAQEAAHRVKGVLDVANDIAVKAPDSPRLTDTELAAAVRHALVWDVLVPHEQIHSTIANGWVTREGEVENWNQREDAKRAIRNLSGIRGITERIAIKPHSILPSRVRQAIQEALERQAEHEAREIELKVDEDEVTLLGMVHSWAEREAIIRAATGTPGVRRVNSELTVQPYFFH